MGPPSTPAGVPPGEASQVAVFSSQLNEQSGNLQLWSGGIGLVGSFVPGVWGKTDPGETDPGETDPGETGPGETDPSEPEPVFLVVSMI